MRRPTADPKITLQVYASIFLEVIAAGRVGDDALVAPHPICAGGP